MALDVRMVWYLQCGHHPSRPTLDQAHRPSTDVYRLSTCARDFGMSNPLDFTPDQVARMEQAWAHASEVLDGMIDSARIECAKVVKDATGMTDRSVLFDYVLYQIGLAERDNPLHGHVMTMVMCAAAVTRLA